MRNPDLFTKDTPTMTPEETSHALIQTLPLFEMMRMRASTTARRHPALGFASDDPGSGMRWVNQFTHTRRLLGPRDREVVSPNNDTLYSNAWLDLADGPVLIESPDMGERYWTLGLLDAWTNPFAYVGRRTTGNRPQRTLIHGPGWKGPVPPGVTSVIAAPGHDVWLIGRMLVDHSATDHARVHALQASLKLLRTDGRPAASRLDARLGLPATGTPTAEHYLAAVTHGLQRNPVPAGEALHWPPPVDELPAALIKMFDELRRSDQPHDLGGGWALPVTVRTHWGQDHLTRARVARNLIGALGIEEAMYAVAEVDASGQALDGSRPCELRFAPHQVPKVDAFWSLTMYRRSDCLLVDNPIGRHSIGDRTPGLRWEADGGLLIRMQASDPGPGANWLPTPPGDTFYVVLRLYQPQAQHLSLQHEYPPIRPL